MSGEVLDADVVEEKAEAPMAVVPAAPPTLAVTPQVEATELKARLDVIQEAQQKAMIDGTDYGVVPGTGKPTLLKPGAEKLSVLFQLDVQLANEKRWGPGDHLTVVSKATVFHAPTGSRLGYGEGVCSTREKKYAYRTAQRTCPNCGAEAIIKGKEEYGGGWLCFKRKGGCGAKWDDGAQEIESQNLGQVDNPDLPDAWNTVVKMAEKRARVDAVLAVTGASALFTQDVEDQEVAKEAEAAAPQGIGETAALELLAVCKSAGLGNQQVAEWMRDNAGMPSPLAVAVAQLSPQQAQAMRTAAKRYEETVRQAKQDEKPEPEATDATE